MSQAALVPRVLFVTGAYYPEFSAGGLQCQATARLLKGRVDVRVLTTATNLALPAHDTIEGVPVSRIGIDVQRRASRAGATLRLLIELLKIVPSVDVVHVQGFSTKNILVSAVAKLFRRPVVLHLQTAKHDEPGVVATQGRLAWWAFSTADLYLSVSPGLAEHYLAAQLPPGRIREVPNGVDPQQFSPSTAEERAALRRKLKLPLERPLVLFVGVMSPDKQPHILLEAWASLQANSALASTLVFVGATDPALFELGGRLVDRVRADAAASGFGDRVLFVPPTGEIQDYFRAADVFAMPSAREGLPIVLLEAMACGLPTVASHLPGATDAIVNDGANGRLVDPGNVQALAAGLATVLGNPADAARMGAAARRTIEERFTMSRVAEQWLAAYNEVLGRRP